MVKSDNNYNVSIAKLEAKMETMSDKLNKLDEIEKTLQSIQKCLNDNHTDTMIATKDIDILGEKYRAIETDLDKTKIKLDLEIKNVNKKIDALTLKVTSIVSVISFIGWVIVTLVSKFWN